MSQDPAKPKFYITTPIYYVNARPHLGHAYTTIVADAIARYKRMQGFDVVLLSGTDEHGQKVERSARAAGVEPQQFVDTISSEYRTLWEQLGLGIDRFVRTTELRHAHAVQLLFRRIQANGWIYKGHYEGNYCVFDEMYVEDPTPGVPCPECGRPTERIREENYFFKLKDFQQRLLAYYEAHPEFIQPETRRNEVLSFVQGGLRDLSISRTTLKWGIPWPGDEKHVYYVWSDALTSYLTGIGFADSPNEFARLWPADLHLIGKEILRFHAVFWPAFLMAADVPLPKQMFAHGWWLFDQEKMSKSRGNVRRPQPIVAVLGIDALRYFLLREMVFGQDGNFSYDALITRYNADLANGLGNLASRVLTMIERNLGGAAPSLGQGPASTAPAGSAEGFDDANLAEIAKLYESYKFSQALEKIWGLIANWDKYLAAEKPWTYAEDPGQRERLARTLSTAAEALRIISILAHPVLPNATQKIWQQLGRRERLEDQRIDQVKWGTAAGENRIGKLEAIFPRVERAQAIERMEAMEQDPQQKPAAPAASGETTPTKAPAATGSAAPAAETGVAPAAPATPAKIGIEDFAKIELRVGQIKSAERVPKADKLLMLQVDIGDEVRQIVAGIATAYEPDKLIGRKVIVVVNLQPRKLRGVESNGMIVAASAGPDGAPVLAGFLEDVPVGAKLK
jgi:methionyl-tRNA synthetase